MSIKLNEKKTLSKCKYNHLFVNAIKMTFAGKMHIGQKIRLLRVSQRLTQQQLAEKIHKERPLISHIERTGKIHHQTLLDICKALKVSAEQLEFASDEPFAGYAKGTPNELQLIKTENERLKTELKLKDEIIQALKAHLKEINSGRKRS